MVAGCTGGPRHNDPNSLALARYRSNGALDPSFGDHGKVTTDLSRKGGDCALDVAIQRDGKIVVAGSSGFGRAHSRFAIVRYNPDGRLDSTFGGDGRVTTDFTPDSDWATAVAIQADGKIVAAGQSGEDFSGANTMFAVVRYNPDGSRDATFGERGRVTTDFTPGDDLAQGIALQADGKIVVAGFSRGGFALARYEADGTPDATFGTNGTVTDPGTAGPGDAASDVEILSDGKILIAGSNGTGGCESCGSDMSTSFALMRFNVDGTIDTTFEDQGLVLTAVSAKDDAVSDLAVQTDGRIVVAGVSRQRRGGGGDSRFALARYDADGSLDPTFGGGGVITTNFSPSWDFATGMAISLTGGASPRASPTTWGPTRGSRWRGISRNEVEHESSEWISMDPQKDPLVTAVLLGSGTCSERVGANAAPSPFATRGRNIEETPSATRTHTGRIDEHHHATQA